MVKPRDCLHRQKIRIERRFIQHSWQQVLFEIFVFGIKQAWACLFGALMLLLILGTYAFYPSGAVLHRYDFITLCAIIIQLLLLLTRLETLEETRIILVFHLVGTAMEIFKTYIGSWTYPEAAILRIVGVPLFSGFMYASVGSYIARVWRIFDFKFTVGLMLVALFIWFAENLGTFAQAWAYPSQQTGWKLVSAQKFGSWFLLMIVSFVLVASIHRPVTFYKKLG